MAIRYVNFALRIKGREIKETDIDRVIESASTVYVPLDREILHVVPSEYIIDGTDGIVRPLGMSGVRLEVKVNIITASHSVIENILRCCEKAGLKVVELVLEPIASSKAVLTEEELEHGTVFMDIGGGKTDAVVFKNGTMRHAAVIPIGGNHITNDISIGMRIPQKEAEKLKRQSSLKDASQRSSEPIIKIMRSRCDELIASVKKELNDAILEYKPHSIVITGGAALLDGIDKVAEAHIGLPVRIGYPERAKSALLKDLSKRPEFSTALGLSLYGFEEEFKDGSYESFGMDVLEGLSGLSGGFSRMQEWGAGVRRLLSRFRSSEL